MTSPAKREMLSKPNSWSVSVNGVSVGRIQNDDYHRICAEVRRDRWLLLRQLLNVAGTALRLAAVAVLLPWTLIGAGITLMVWFPEMSPTIRFEFVMASVYPVSMVTIAALLGTVALFPSTLPALGYQNLFRAKLDEKVREEVCCPALGSVYLLDDRAFTAQAHPVTVEHPQP